MSDVPYFAYGSNLSRERMARRCPGAALLGTARLAGHRFVINRRGYATVVPEPGATVYGVLWDLSETHGALLDRYEGVEQGLYRREPCRVEPVAGGRPVDAWLYVAADRAPGTPRSGYLDLIL
ncbi:MAG TPA: gamma-glutamylcyclotransferase family protein, partial [Gemmatimonadales bacterium]|nr:gamma-glutamylcyclotransferase family protein [Gemmatimonadales bacterium]